MSTASVLSLPDNRRIAYCVTGEQLPAVIFFTGFKSDMSGSKAMALQQFCETRGQRFIRFDYTGHGESSGQFIEGTIGSWAQDAADVLEQLGSAQNILVGSSMGAWIAMLLAQQNPQRVAGFVGIASAPDFTEELIWQRLNDTQKAELLEKGVFYAPSCYGEEPYPITQRLIEEARAHLLLNRSIAIEAPVRLIHGTQDEDVPWQHSVRLMEQLSSRDVRLQLIKDGNHRLSEPAHLQTLCSTLEDLLDRK
ncbi:MAG: alpha/beta hydrolase [Rickettsiales bacterium]|nr:alpha/beta hydrolase [Rickettsiales bacterium]